MHVFELRDFIRIFLTAFFCWGLKYTERSTIRVMRSVGNVDAKFLKLDDAKTGHGGIPTVCDCWMSFVSPVPFLPPFSPPTSTSDRPRTFRKSRIPTLAEKFHYYGPLRTYVRTWSGPGFPCSDGHVWGLDLLQGWFWMAVTVLRGG